MEAAPRHWLERYRSAIYPLLNLAVILAAIVGSMLHGEEPGKVVYVCILTAICSAPLLFLRGWNDRYVLLGIFMAVYFLEFGALDLAVLVAGTDVLHARPEFLSSAEIAVLLGAALILGAYLLGVQLGLPKDETTSARSRGVAAPPEWSTGMMLFLGLGLWLAGTSAMVYLQIFAAPEKTVHSSQSAFATMGPLMVFIVMLGHMMQPLGILILSYAYSKHRGLFWGGLIVAVVLVEVAVGFVMDVKRVALMAAALVILTRTLVDNRLPKLWIVCSLAGLVLVFPVFQAYRMEITGARGLDRLQALRELPKVLSIALQAAEKEKETPADPAERPQSFLERSSVKDALETLFAHVPREVPYLYGRSLVALPMAFVPRLVAPEKEDISAGQLYTKQVLKADTDTYISISHLGELYWNFGWLGVLLGLPIGGVLLGYVGARFNLEHGASVTRILVLLATVQGLCIQFEGTVPVSYILWLRSMAAIGLLHLMFARERANTERRDTAAPEPTAFEPALLGPRFPNLMR
jgi:hypothetical protein